MVDALGQAFARLAFQPVGDAAIQVFGAPANANYRREFSVQPRCGALCFIMNNDVVDALKRNAHAGLKGLAAHFLGKLACNPVDALMGEADCFGQGAFRRCGDVNFPRHRIDLQNQSFGAAIDARDKRRRAGANIDFGSGDVINRHNGYA